MNTEEALSMLINYLKQYGNNFVFHKEFIKDISNILTRIKGNEKEFFSLMIKQFNFVIERGRNVHLTDSNEILKYVEGFDCYSLYLVSRSFNIRFLMTFENGISFFLVAFNEKSGKRRTNYFEKVPIAKSRLNQLLEVEENE